MYWQSRRLKRLENGDIQFVLGSMKHVFLLMRDIQDWCNLSSAGLWWVNAFRHGMTKRVMLMLAATKKARKEITPVPTLPRVDEDVFSTRPFAKDPSPLAGRKHHLPCAVPTQIMRSVSASISSSDCPRDFRMHTMHFIVMKMAKRRCRSTPFTTTGLDRDEARRCLNPRVPLILLDMLTVFRRQNC